VLLVPELSEVEWRIADSISEWADVATFDVPGVGDEPADGPLSRESVARRALAELDTRGWNRCVVVADEWAVPNAIELARRRPEAVAAMALGHACLDFTGHGEQASVQSGILDALQQLGATDFRMWARHVTQVTKGAYDDEMTEEFLRRVPEDVAMEFFGSLRLGEAGPVRETLESLGVPLLFAEHTDCLMFTHEGFAEMEAAFPDARVVRVPDKPSTSPGFAQALRELCDSIGETAGSLQGDAQPPG
jgi:hypothetical protein